MNRLTLEKNLVLSAGAGTGKTYSLMTLALHVLGGARRGREPLPCAKLCIVTFTEKAAAQLRERLALRVEGLCHPGVGQAAEPELRAAFSELGLPFPSVDFWRGVRETLPAAQVGTFHALALRWLRRLAQEGVAAHSTLLDEESARALLEDCVERTVVAKLDEGNDAAIQLCSELGFSARGRAGGLIDEVANLLLRVREEGVAPASLKVGTVEEARAAFASHLERLRRDLREAEHERASPRTKEALAALADGLHGSLDIARLSEIARAGIHLSGARGAGGDCLKRIKYGVLGDRASRTPGLADFQAQVATAPLEAGFRALLVEAARRYRDEQEARGAMDFAELLERVRDGWRDFPESRRAAQARVGVLMVDELQDTNRVQLELVALLAEERAGGPRALVPSFENDWVQTWPLEPGLLAVVGDRKQSIYEFRGADVSLFEVLAQRIDASDGERAFLQTNHRTTPELLELFNHGFGRWMGAAAEGRDYEVVFGPGDVLYPARPSLVRPRRVERLLFEPGETRRETLENEAQAMARLLAATLAEPVSSEGRLRGGDIAVLFRRSTHLELYRQALVQARVPHQIWRGRGFFAAPEVRDAESLLAFLCDPDDVTSLVALLRSPFVGLSDAGVLALAEACGGRLSREAARRLVVPPALLPHEEAARLRRFWELEEGWRSRRDRSDARELLLGAFEDSGYLVAAAAGPHGDQVLANIDKLLERSARAARRGMVDAASFAVELARLLRSPSREAQAELQDGVDPDAVQLLTVHQSKGLEWPMVVVPDLLAARNRSTSKLVFERKGGLGLKTARGRELDAPEGISPRYRALSDESARRADAEDVRLFYVALTRARDRLVLLGLGEAFEAGEPSGWKGSALGVTDEALMHLTETLEAPGPPAANLRVVATTEPDAAAMDSLVGKVQALRAPSSPGEPRLMLGLQEWVTAADCARRRWLEYVRGERPPLRPVASVAPVPRTNASFQSSVVDGKPWVQVRAAVWQEEVGESKTLWFSAAVDAMSARGMGVAQSLLARAAMKCAPEGWTTAVKVTSVRTGATPDGLDTELSATDTELTLANLTQADPPRLPAVTCQAWGCEFFPRCHPQSSSERV